jgi:hypothetical protein
MTAFDGCNAGWVHCAMRNVLCSRAHFDSAQRLRAQLLTVLMNLCVGVFWGILIAAQVRSTFNLDTKDRPLQVCVYCSH